MATKTYCDICQDELTTKNNFQNYDYLYEVECHLDKTDRGYKIKMEITHATVGVDGRSIPDLCGNCLAELLVLAASTLSEKTGEPDGN